MQHFAALTIQPALRRQGGEPTHHRLGAAEQPIAQRLDIRQFLRQPVDLRHGILSTGQFEHMRRLLECRLHLFAQFRVGHQRFHHRRGIAHNWRIRPQPCEQTGAQSGGGEPEMMRLGLPTCLATDHFLRQLVPQRDARDMIECCIDQREHPVVLAVLRDIEFTPQHAQRQRGFALAKRDHHHLGAIGFRAAESDARKHVECAIVELATRPFRQLLRHRGLTFKRGRHHAAPIERCRKLSSEQ